MADIEQQFPQDLELAAQLGAETLEAEGALWVKGRMDYARTGTVETPAARYFFELSVRQLGGTAIQA